MGSIVLVRASDASSEALARSLSEIAVEHSVSHFCAQYDGQGHELRKYLPASVRYSVIPKYCDDSLILQALVLLSGEEGLGRRVGYMQGDAVAWTAPEHSAEPSLGSAALNLVTASKWTAFEYVLRSEIRTAMLWREKAEEYLQCVCRETWKDVLDRKHGLSYRAAFYSKFYQWLMARSARSEETGAYVQAAHQIITLCRFIEQSLEKDRSREDSKVLSQVIFILAAIYEQLSQQSTRYVTNYKALLSFRSSEMYAISCLLGDSQVEFERGRLVDRYAQPVSGAGSILMMFCRTYARDATSLIRDAVAVRNLSLIGHGSVGYSGRMLSEQHSLTTAVRIAAISKNGTLKSIWKTLCVPVVIPDVCVNPEKGLFANALDAIAES